MTQTTVLTTLQQMLLTVAELSAPILLAALVVGVVISLIQAVTQINEQTLSFVPKVIAIALVLVLAGPWMVQTLVGYAAHLFAALPTLAQ